MASTSETGHAINVANFQRLIAFATAYGQTYNPSKVSLKIPALQASYNNANDSLGVVISKNTDFNSTVNLRVEAFANLRPLATRLISALEATDATPEKIKDAKTINRKLQGRRAPGTTAQTAGAGPQTPQTPDTPAPNTISVSQLSYDQLVQHFSALIAVLKSETTYAPNEADLKLPALLTKTEALHARNLDVATAFTGISNARINRNKLLYNQNTGLLDTAAEVKNYIKSIFGATGAEYAQVSGLKFKNTLKK